MLDKAWLEEIAALRRQFHTFPELSYHEFQTTKLVAETLEKLNLKLIPFTGLKTGGYCEVGTGPYITFRSDIDALPISENPDHFVKSSNRNVMHACGHDYHIAFGLALLKYFSTNVLKNHALRVLFQPAEEAYPTGAIKVCEEPIWRGIKYFITAHIQNDLPIGKVAVCQGIANASSTSIKLTLHGKGGHTSRPHEGNDLVRLCADYINTLYSFLAQNMNPIAQYILAFGSIEGGKTHNVIPEHITLKGTLRTLQPDIKDNILNLCKTFSQKFADLCGIQIQFTSPTYCPPVVNDSTLVKLLQKLFTHKDDLIILANPSFGADDFAFYLTKAPGIYLKIGGGGTGIAHSSDFEVNESALEPAIYHLIDYIRYLDENG